MGEWNQNWKYPPNSSQFLHFLFFDISYPGSMAVQNPEQSAGYGKKQLQEMPSAIYLKTKKKKIFSPYGEIPYFHLFCFSFLSSPSPQTVHQQLKTQRQSSSRHLKPWGRGTLILVRETGPQDIPILFFFLFLSSCCSVLEAHSHGMCTVELNCCFLARRRGRKTSESHKEQGRIIERRELKKKNFIIVSEMSLPARGSICINLTSNILPKFLRSDLQGKPLPRPQVVMGWYTSGTDSDNTAKVLKLTIEPQFTELGRKTVTPN